MYARLLLALATCAYFSDALLAQTANGRTEPRRDVSTVRTLNQRIPEVAFQEAPFEQVMEWVTEFTQLNVVVRWEKLTDAGVERDKQISIKVRNLRLSQVLWMIMNEAGGSDVKLAYRASGNLLVLSTEEDLGKEMMVKVYDVSDLLTRVPRFTNAPRLDPAQALNSLGQGGTGGGGGGGGSSQLFQTDEQEEENENENGEDAEMQQLVQLIVDTVEPDTWVQNGGTGTVTPFRRQIIVRNSILVHQMLGGYVEDQN